MVSDIKEYDPDIGLSEKIILFLVHLLYKKSRLYVIYKNYGSKQKDFFKLTFSFISERNTKANTSSSLNG